MILIAGGAGISACTSVLEELGGRIVRGEPGVRTTRIMLWWMVRDESEYLLVDTLRSEVRETLIRKSALGAKEWVEAQLAESTRYLKDKIDLRLFVTGETDRDGVVNSTASSPSLDTGDEKLEIEEEKPVKSTWSVYRRAFFLARGLFQPSSHATETLVSSSSLQLQQSARQAMDDRTQPARLALAPPAPVRQSPTGHLGRDRLLRAGESHD